MEEEDAKLRNRSPIGVLRSGEAGRLLATMLIRRQGGRGGGVAGILSMSDESQISREWSNAVSKRKLPSSSLGWVTRKDSVGDAGGENEVGEWSACWLPRLFLQRSFGHFGPRQRFGRGKRPWPDESSGRRSS